MSCLPLDSATTTAKNLMAPLTSLNQLQLKLKRMEDLVTTEDLSLTRVLRGGTGGPTGGHTLPHLLTHAAPTPGANLTVDHGDHAVLSLIAGHPRGDGLHGHPVALVGLQLRDDVAAGVSSRASGVDQAPGVLVETLDGVGVVVGLRGHPRAGDGGGALRATVEAVDSLRLCRTQKQGFMLKQSTCASVRRRSVGYTATYWFGC